MTDGLIDEIVEDPYVMKDNDSTNTTYSPIGATMNIVQESFKCCGILGFNDFVGSKYTKNVVYMDPKTAEVSPILLVVGKSWP